MGNRINGSGGRLPLVLNWARSSWMTLSALCCSCSALTVFAVVVICSLIPVFILRGGNNAGVASAGAEQSINLDFATNLATFGSQSTTNLDQIADQINRYLGYRPNTLGIQLNNMNPSQSTTKKRKRQSANSLSCNTSNKLAMGIVVNSCPANQCKIPPCLKQCIPKVKSDIASKFGPAPVPLNVTTSNGTEMSGLIQFCSFNANISV